MFPIFKTRRTAVAALLAFALVVLIAAGAMVAHQSASRMMRTLFWVDHAREVRFQLEQAMLRIVDAEATERGYLLTHKQAFRDAFEPNVKAAEAALERVRVLTADNANQQKELVDLLPVFHAKISRMRNQITLRDTDGLSPAIDSVATLEGKRMMDQIRRAISKMGEHENALLTSRAATAREALQMTLLGATIGGGLAIALLGLTGWMIYRETAARRASKHAAEAARAYAESIVDTVREPLVVLGRDLRVQSANRAFYEAFHCQPESTCGRSLFELKEGAWDDEALRQHVVDAIDQDQLFTGLELKYSAGDGGTRTLSLNGRRLYRPGTGQTAALLAIEDITEQKSLVQIHLQFRALFESLPGLYLVMRPDMTIVAVSDAYLKAINRTREELLGIPFEQVFTGADEAEQQTLRDVSASLQRASETGRPDTMAIQRFDIPLPGAAVASDNERYWSPVNSAVLGEDGRVEYLIHRVEDVTAFVKSRTAAKAQPAEDSRAKMEQMEAEMFANSHHLDSVNKQLRAANHELEAFSYSVSHDLRAPLRHIAGFSDLLKKHLGAALDEKGQRYLSTIMQSTSRMGQLIDDLLSFSRMARSELRYGKVDLDHLVAGVVAEFQSTMEERHIEWKLAPLGIAEGDSALLRQAFVNLVSNAVKYSRPRDPAVIEIGTHAAPGRMNGYFVRDNGVGFDSAYGGKLFGVFQRLHRADEFEGTGIGLANVRRIISRHGGSTWAESELGKGATFYFSLPQVVPLL